MNMVGIVCVVVLGLSALLGTIRATVGPTMLDRMVALEVMLSIVVTSLGLYIGISRDTTLLPVLVVVTLLGFSGSVSVARFSARERER